MTTQPPAPKLSLFERILCAWPICLVIVGGLVGGACGGLAWAINERIMRSARPMPVRYALIVASGLVAIAVYFAVIFLLALIFPSVFHTR